MPSNQLMELKNGATPVTIAVFHGIAISFPPSLAMLVQARANSLRQRCPQWLWQALNFDLADTP